MKLTRLAWLLLLITIGACSSPSTPSAVTQFSPSTPVANPTLAETQSPTESLPTATPSCTNNLLFIEDDTIPDGTVVSAGSEIDKRWLVRNTGTCNWDEQHTLLLVAGIEMGVDSPYPMIPAVAGAEGVLRILFTAPLESGTYRSAWQPVGPDGEYFGDSVFIEIVVP